MAVEKEANPGAKVKFWVLELGTEARLASTNTQKLKTGSSPWMRPAVGASR